MIRFQNVSCGYGRTKVLHGVNLKVDKGEMVAVLGPNGSGKTTLLLALSGILPISSGRIEVSGESIARLTDRQRAKLMASVPQQTETPFDLKVSSLVLMGRYPYLSFIRGYGREDRESADRAMRETATMRFARRTLGELSGGEAQRVYIARALAQGTDILLLDEATSGLDAARKVEIYDLLAYKNRQGMTIVSAIHDLNHAALYSRRLIFLKQGRVVLDGPVENTFTEKNLTGIYETEIKISRHPETGAPQAHLVPGRADPVCGG